MVNGVSNSICYGFRGYDCRLCTRCLSRVLPHLETSKVLASIEPRHCRASDQSLGYIRNPGLVGRSLNTVNGRLATKYVDGKSRHYVTTSFVIAPALSPRFRNYSGGMQLWLFGGTQRWCRLSIDRDNTFSPLTEGRTILGERKRLTAVSLHFKLMKGTSRGTRWRCRRIPTWGLRPFCLGIRCFRVVCPKFGNDNVS